MSSSSVMICSSVPLLLLLVVVVCLVSAAEDEPFLGQREVTFDLDQIMEDLQQMETDVLQRPIDVTELLDPKTFSIKNPELGVGDSGPPRFGPRSFGPPAMAYPVKFPLAQPTPDNLQAICLHGEHRPRYLISSYFPASGYGQLKRRAEAVNNAEFWFDTCCKANQTWERDVTLCCAKQAWELFVETFCEADSSVKDRLYQCCRLSGTDRLNCFDKDAPNPNYEATQVLPETPIPPTTNFSFDQNTCQRTQMTPYRAKADKKKKEKKVATPENVDISFPQGRPTADAIESLCGNQKLRPLYQTRCLPRYGFEWLARQAKTVNRIEKGFRQCCKKKTGVLNCAEQKWSDEIDRFCSTEDNFSCCSSQSPADRYSCFHSMSKDPHYNKTSAPEEMTLNSICDTHKLIDRKFQAGIPLKIWVRQCCRLPEEEKTTCLAQRAEEASIRFCQTKGRVPSTYRHCCRLLEHEVPQCLTKVLTDAGSKATSALRQKQRKTCPLS